MQSRMTNSRDSDNSGNADVSNRLAEILDRQGVTDEALAIVNKLLMSAQRQDENTNNLTKAVKMYGKPLMDIPNPVTELAATRDHGRKATEARAETARRPAAGVIPTVAESRTLDFPTALPR